MDHIFVMDVITRCKNVINLKILLLFMLKKVYTELKHEVKKLFTNLIDKKGIL